MAMVSVKAGTSFRLPVLFVDENFDSIESIEFMFKQDKDDDSGEALKTALWSRSGTSRDAAKIDGRNAIAITFTRSDTYLFEQGEDFWMDTRIHYEDSEDNPPTNLVKIRMSNTLFESGEEAEGHE